MSIPIANPDDRDWTKTAYRFQFGAYGRVVVDVHHSGLEDALEEAAEWLSEHNPGIFTQYDELDDESKAHYMESGEVIDHTYTEHGFIPSWEWHVSEIPAGQVGKPMGVVS